MVEALLSVAQLVIATLVSALVAYLSLWAIEAGNRRIELWKELARGNAAMGVVTGAAVVSLAIILRQAVVLPHLADLPLHSNPGAGLIAMAIQLAIGVLLGVAALVFGLWLFSRLTGEIDEIAEIKRGNLAVAALLAGTLLAVGLLAGVAVDQIGSAVAGWVLL